MTLTINLPIAPEILNALGITDTIRTECGYENGAFSVKLSAPEARDAFDDEDDFDEDGFGGGRDFDEDCFADEDDPWQCAECEHFCPKHNRCLME